MEQLGDVTPRRDLVTIEVATLGWTDLIGRAWERRRRSSFRLWRSASAPCISLSGRTFEDWFAARSANFRKETRRLERRLEPVRAPREQEELIAERAYSSSSPKSGRLGQRSAVRASHDQ